METAEPTRTSEEMNATTKESGELDKKSDAYIMGARSPLITITDLASKQLLSFLVESIVLILTPFMATEAIENKKATMAAISVAGPFEYIAELVGWFLQVGGCSEFAQFLGKREAKNAQTLLSQMLIVGWSLSVLIAIVLLPCLKEILRALVDKNEGETVITYAYHYIIPYLAGSPLIVTFYILLSVFMGSGKMNYYLVLVIGQEVLCCGVLCPVLLFCTDLQIWAPPIAYITSFVIPIIAGIYLVQKKTPIHINLKLAFDKKKWIFMIDCLGVGIIDMLASASGMIVMGTVESIISQIGKRFSAEVAEELKVQTYEAVLAAWGCLSRVYEIVVGVSYNTTGSYLSIASYAIGSGRYKRLFELSVVICFVTCILVFIVTILVIILAKYVAMIFDSSPLYLELAENILRIFCITGVILPLQFIVTTFCQAVQYYKTGIIVAIVTEICLIPILFVILFFSTKEYSPRKNFYLSMLSFNLNDIISAVISIAVMYSCLKKICKEHNVKMSWSLAFRKTDLSQEEWEEYNKDNEEEVKKSEEVVAIL